MNDIRLHIERLVVDGIRLGAADARVLHAAVEAELSRRLSNGGVAATLAMGAALPTMTVPAIQLGATADPAALGRQIGGAVYVGIGR